MQNKPELRLPLLDDGTSRTDIPFLELLHAQCDDYGVFDKTLDPAGLTDWDYGFGFLLWKGQSTMYAVLYPYSDAIFWLEFQVNGVTVRGLPTDQINVFSLARRVRDLVTWVYETAAQVTPEACTWLMSSIEDDDGYGTRRKWVMDKFFVLDRVESWTHLATCETITEEAERPVYMFIPRELTIGENSMFAPKVPDSAPEKSAA